MYKKAGNKDISVNEDPIVSEPPNKNRTDSVEEASNSERYIKEIFTQANKGRIPGIPFTLSETKRTEINQKWGASTHISDTEKGRYEGYKEQQATIGYFGQTVNDIRSYTSELRHISLTNIKKIGGEPDAVRYYKDETHDQIILVYRTTAKADLLWVLPRPTKREPNPKVDHLSLYAQLEKKLNLFANQSTSKIISSMSLDEKIGQMILAGISGTSVDNNVKWLLNEHHVGGVIFYGNNFRTPVQAVKLVNNIKEANNSDVPLLLGVDQEGGSVTRLPGDFIPIPSNKQVGEVGSREYSYQIGKFLGKQLQAFGLNINFAPVLDVNNNPNNPVIGDRAFGDNPKIVRQLGVEMMKGIQSQSVIPTVKHFPGHGDTSVDSHLELPIIHKTFKELKKLEFIPFESAFKEGADVVMVGHILLPKLDNKNPASMSKVVMKDVLRKQLGFTGLIVTDDMTMGAIKDNFDLGKAAVESVKSGSDIILVGHDDHHVAEVFNALKRSVQQGEISEKRVNESVKRILKLKKKYNIHDDKVEGVDIEAMNRSLANLLNAY